MILELSKIYKSSWRKRELRGKSYRKSLHNRRTTEVNKFSIWFSSSLIMIQTIIKLQPRAFNHPMILQFQIIALKVWLQQGSNSEWAPRSRANRKANEHQCQLTRVATCKTFKTKISQTHTVSLQTNLAIKYMMRWSKVFLWARF